MKKILLLTLLLLMVCGQAYSQEDQSKKDTVATKDVPYSDESGVGSVSEGQDDDEIGSNSYIPGLLHSSQDVYTSNTSYTFSIAYFRPRGYDNEYQTVSINNFMMNSSVTGRASYSQWGGLNHVVRYPEVITNLNAPNFTFGNVGGASNYDLRASAYRKQIRATYSLSNRTYTNRLMLTGATGVLQNGWSFAASLSTRFGSQLSYVDGSVYNAFSYFLSAEKKINNEHAVNLVAFGTPTQRSLQGNSVQEAYDLVGSNYYNPNWGWYNGEQRNARIRTIHEPVIMLTHYFTPKENKYTITTTLATTFGKNSSTAMNWYDVQDPRPDYYRYLPSYQTTDALQDYMTQQWLNDASVRQIDWDHMYYTNQYNAIQGLRAQYMIEDRVYSHFQLGGSSNLVYNLNDNTKLAAGIDIRGMRQSNYKTISDLLGGLYWLDVDKYSEGDFPEEEMVAYNDLDNPGAELKEGDVFGYNYDYHIYNQLLWAILNFNYSKVEFFVGANVGGTEYWRDGKMRNGRFPDDSKGKSDVASFANYGFKAGITYKITGRNYLLLNGQYSSDAPNVLNAFLSPRTRNAYVANLSNERILAADLSYVMNYPFMKMRITGYYTKFLDRTELVSFYHDDLSSMVNYSMSGIDQRHIGIELGAEIKLGAMFSLILAGNFGDYIYTSRPKVLITADNGYDILGDNNREQTQEVYWKNYHVDGSPQIATTLGLKFNHNYWWVNINANYFDKIYCSMNPERRTTLARGSLPDDSELLADIIGQTRLKGQFTLDASVSKSWRIKSKYNIGFNISVTNILNNKNLVTTAWEQRRFDFSEYNVNKFQNKYYYAFGTTFYAGINFQF